MLSESVQPGDGEAKTLAAPLIIGLGHRKRVGKDTFAEMLVSEFKERGIEVIQLAFAKDLKKTAEQLFGFYGLRDGQYYEQFSEERKIPLKTIGKTPRQLWIELGQAVRNIYPDAWVDQTRREIRDLINEYKVRGETQPVFIITDVRFPNEAEMIRSMGGTLIKVIRPDIPDTDDSADCALASYDGWDFWINNDGSLADLAWKAYLLSRVF